MKRGGPLKRENRGWRLSIQTHKIANPNWKTESV